MTTLATIPSTMKQILRLSILCLAAAATSAMSAANIKMTAEDADKMRDVEISNMDEEASLEIILDQLGDRLEGVSKRYLADDQTLEIHFTDIDLAGEFEPWHPYPKNEIRWVKAIYIPRLEFDYKLTDKDGNVIKEGSEKLSDSAFQMRMSRLGNNESTYYEQEMLAGWLRSNFHKDKKAKS